MTWPFLLASWLFACSPPAEPEEPSISSTTAITPLGAPQRRFAFLGADGQLITHKSVYGRMTVVALVASYDTASLAQTRFVEALYRRHRPRINALLLFLDPPENRPLIETYGSTVGVSFPIALADTATRAGKGAFPGLHHVPSVVILDRQGREVWRKLGLVDTQELGEAVSDNDRLSE
jgi:hypothetical protein